MFRGTPTQDVGGGNQQKRQRRKPLGWYLTEKMLEKAVNDEQPVIGIERPSSKSNAKSRKGSLVDSKGSSDRRHESRDLGRPRANSNTATIGNRAVADEKQITGDTGKDSKDERSKSVTTSPYRSTQKEDYWYYDASSDGFYYEYNGTRGWRKRNPKIHNQMQISTLVHQKNQVVEDDTKNARLDKLKQQDVQQRNFDPVGPLIGNSILQQSMVPPVKTNVKYYDAASDGFFYEMASVDGWRRRQPANFPMSDKSHVQSPLNNNKQRANSTMIHKQHTNIRPSFPLQFQSYISDIGTAPQHHLTQAELDEIILKHLQQRQTSFNTSMGGGLQHKDICFNARSCHCDYNAGIEDPLHSTTCYYCQAAAAHLMNHERIKKLIHSGSSECSNKSDDTMLNAFKSTKNVNPFNMCPMATQFNFDEQKQIQGYFGGCARNKKNSNVNNEHSLNIQQEKFSHPTNSYQLDTNSIRKQSHQSQKALPSSFEEPYEFYWSDSDARSNNSITSATLQADIIKSENMSDINASGEQTLVGTSLSSTENTIEFFKRTQFSPMKELIPRYKSDSLKLQNEAKECSKSLQQKSHGFDVDKFIADLPETYHPENFIQNISLRASIDENHHLDGSQLTNHPCMFTSISPRNSLWTNPDIQMQKNTTRPEFGFEMFAFPEQMTGTIETLDKNIHSIWNSPTTF